MINLTFLNGFGLIYNAEDFYELRTKYRIIGEFFGSTKISQIALPVAISPEQVYFLMKKSIIKLISYPQILDEPSNDNKINHEEFVRNLYEEQKVLLRDERKKQVESYVDQIIKAKGGDRTREDVIKEELDKLPEMEIDNVIIPIYTEHPEYLKGVPQDISLEEMVNYTSKIKRLVFEDLWTRNYYVTSGRKFGGDFLVYLGDPVLFHAVFIVKCLENDNHLMNVSEIVAVGRLGHSVKKKFVLAAANSNDEIKYLTTDWLDNN